MEKELQSKLVEILSAIQAATGKAADFTMSQLPDVAQSYVAYGRAYSTLVFGVFVALMCVGLYVGLKKGFLNKEAVYKGPNQYMQGDWLGSRVCCAVAGMLLASFSGVVAMANAAQLMLVWFAPKVWLLKELAQLIK